MLTQNMRQTHLLLILCFLLIITTIDALNLKKSLDNSEAITKARDQQHHFNSREGEFPLDTGVVYGSAYEEQDRCSIAFDGTNYLIVFIDCRAGHHWDIFGVRVSASGVVLDTAGIPICLVNGVKEYPAVAFDGVNYLVVWEDWRDYPESGIYGARVTTSGTVLDPYGFAISTAPSRQGFPCVAFNGTNYLVVWQDWRNGSYTDIYGARVTTNGVVLDPAGIAVSTATNDQTGAAVAFDGMNYFVVWTDNRRSNKDTYGARVTPTGNVLDPSGIPIDTSLASSLYSSIAFDGANYLIVWSRETGSTYELYGARVAPSGALLDTAGIYISPIEHLWTPVTAVAFDGTNYLAVWDEFLAGYIKIYGARVNPDGIVLDTNKIAISPVSGDQLRPNVAFDDSNYLVTWGDVHPENYDVCGARVNPAGEVLDITAILFSMGANAQIYSSAAFDSSNYLVVWDEWRGKGYDIYGARVSQAGMVLDPVTIAISTADSSQTNPSVAFDGTNYFIVWIDHRNGHRTDIYGARVTPAGIVLDVNGIAISSEPYWQYSPTVAFDGTNYLVVWHDGRSGGPDTDIYGARVSPSGIVLDPNGFVISSASDCQWSPIVTFDGTNYLVVWVDCRNEGNNWGYDIYGARVTPSGIVLDTTGIAIAHELNDQENPGLAFDGNNYLVVWDDLRNSLENSNVYCARVDQAGAVLDTNGILIAGSLTYSCMNPTIGFDGTNYIVVWQDDRSHLHHDLYGARVSVTGTVLSTFVVSDQPKHQLRPAIAEGPGDQLLLTYSSWTDSINSHPVNTMRVWGKFYPFVGIEESKQAKGDNAKLYLQIVPNPMTRNCVIKYGLPQETQVKITIYDSAGRLVKNIFDERQDLGFYQKRVQLQDLAQGIYFIVLKTENCFSTQKVTLIKN